MTNPDHEPRQLFEWVFLDDFGLSIQKPISWEASIFPSDSSVGPSYFIYEKPPENIGHTAVFNVRDSTEFVLSKEMSLDHFALQTMANNNNPNMTPLGKLEIRDGEKPYSRGVFRVSQFDDYYYEKTDMFEMRHKRLASYQMAVANRSNGKMFLMTFAVPEQSWDKYNAIAHKMVDTVRFH